MSEYAFHRNDPAGMLLARAINHAHSATPDLFQDFVVTEAPLCISHIRFYKDAFDCFAGGLAFGFESLA
jgi:hypothetical protein